MRVFCLFFALILLAGCGQKGPLRLPDDNSNGNAAGNTQEQAQ
ncbi:putative small lipoprotein YifL [Litorivivens lipolytica]|uniref:Putative small lipoprotein YifL n=1 Tax=Litorivivens lipolytica TaxID=1524264 RepID=A0A7W4Z6E3_9GAMM|nr:lipoprotein [Litorivivens lipolytica]MBB3048424.1 putative small lipoprotein YifL [Litorivivens lipolytica]